MIKIRLVKYNKKWKESFYKIKKILEKNIHLEITIEHIGSTAIPKIKAAKPIIDVLIGINNNNLDQYIPLVKKSGFEYINKYEKDIPFRRFFIKKDHPKTNIHLVKKSSLWFKRHIAFREELINNLHIREEYENLKIQLSKKNWENGNEYSDEKTEFIRSVEQKIL